MSELRCLGDILDSISITHSFKKNKVIFLNTSDVLEGKILTHNYMLVSDLKGQAKKTIKNGDILFSEIRPKNKRYAYVELDNPEDYVVSTKLMVLRNKTTDVDTDYIYYFLTYSGMLDYLQMRAENRICSFPQITFDVLRPIQVRVPNKGTQKKIAAVLSALDAKIEVNNRINTQLEAMAKTLYDYWFVHNDKVSQWEIKKLGDFIKVNERSITKNYHQNEIEYIDIASVSVGHLEGTLKYELNNAPSRARRLVQHGDTIWSTVRPNRKSYLFICNPKENLVVSTGFAVLTPNKIPPSFLYFLATTEKFVNYLVSNAEGSAYPAVSADRFSEIEFALPPEKKLMEFETIVSPMLSKIAQNEAESKSLAQLRDWLLPMLMNGQVKVN